MSDLILPAVQVTSAYKSYVTNPVVTDLFMTVEAGTTYGLLGASGCGKTTLLSCIVGLKKLDAGDVKIFGGKPLSKSIGYMPQEIALYGVFTIKETLAYYGRIYGMTDTEIEGKTQFLINLLQLPDESSYIMNLSGGQQRRTSFAVALIHEPMLLILDEPTVGVDPLLRERIWKHLDDMVARKGTSVIITTHYIEEARHSHKVGVMRHGKILVESSPISLLTKYDTDTLEDVVLMLCRSQEEQNLINYQHNMLYISKSSKDHSVVGLKYQAAISEGVEERVNVTTVLTDYGDDWNPIEDTKRWKPIMQIALDEYIKVYSILYRNMILHFRQRIFVLVQIILPVFQLFIFHYIMGTEPYGLKFGVVNEDVSNHILSGGQTFMDYCKGRNALNSCFGEGLSCSYFKMFEEGQINWIEFGSKELAVASVEAGDSTGFLTIPKNFSSAIQSRILAKQFTTNESITGSTISFRLDYSNKLNSAYLTRQFYDSYILFLQDVVKQCGVDPRMVDLPLQLKPFYGTINGGWTEFFHPAFILWIIFLIPTGIGILYVQDANSGTLDRTLIAGVKFRHVLLGTLISEAIITIIQLLFCFGFLLGWFNFQVVGSLTVSFLMAFGVGMVGVTLGLFFGVVCDREFEVIMAVSSVYMITVPASGGWWPIDGVEKWYKIVSYMIPVTVPLESLRSVMNRGWGTDNIIVGEGFLVIFGWILLCCILSLVIHSRKQK